MLKSLRQNRIKRKMCRERAASTEQESSTDFFFFLNIFFPTYPTNWCKYKFLAPKQTFQEKKNVSLPPC